MFASETRCFTRFVAGAAELQPHESDVAHHVPQPADQPSADGPQHRHAHRRQLESVHEQDEGLQARAPARRACGHPARRQVQPHAAGAGAAPLSQVDIATGQSLCRCHISVI